MKNNELSIEELELVTGGFALVDTADVTDNIFNENENKDCNCFVSIYTNW